MMTNNACRQNKLSSILRFNEDKPEWDANEQSKVDLLRAPGLCFRYRGLLPALRTANVLSFPDFSELGVFSAFSDTHRLDIYPHLLFSAC